MNPAVRCVNLNAFYGVPAKILCSVVQDLINVVCT